MLEYTLVPAGTSPAGGDGFYSMTAQPPEKPDAQSGRKAPRPEWANGLRQLYDSVVEEPLPDSFKDLLSKLDSPAKGRPPEGGGDAR